ncbi:MAG: hypothetical protein GWO24_15370 [Akkermansiaceae bacterium]|nr:hypothetical protein [Akkermansiaceae bacterium]
MLAVGAAIGHLILADSASLLAYALAAAALALAAFLFRTRESVVPPPQISDLPASDVAAGPAPLTGVDGGSRRELAHFVESRVQEILAEFTPEEAGEERVAMAREMGVSFQPGEPLVYWEGHPVLCGGPVAQAQVCPQHANLVVLLTEESCDARLEVYGRAGDKESTFAPPDGFAFVELRLGYVPPFATKQVAAVVLCRSAQPIDGAQDWHFQIDTDCQRLHRLQPIAGT